MPKVESTPEHLRPYIFHGVDLFWKDGEDNAAGDCPWCGREGKFSVAISTGMWKCWVCNEGTDKGGGNVYTFIRKLWELSEEATKLDDLAELAKSRRLLQSESLITWGLAKSILTRNWLLPCSGPDGQLKQLYQWKANGQRMVLYPTPTLGHKLFGPEMPTSISTIYLCEGPWDAIALWEVARQAKYRDDSRQLTSTANVGASLLSDAVVLAVPTCSTFEEPWLPLFRDKSVSILFDSDHPKVNPNTKNPVPPAGYNNIQRNCRMLAGVAKSVSYLAWGKDGYDPALPSGYDVRDALSLPSLPNLSNGPSPTSPTNGNGKGESSLLSNSPLDTLGQRVAALDGLLRRVVPAPAAWVPTKAKAGKNSGKPSPPKALECLPCSNFKSLISAWKRALVWTEGLDRAFSAMLAAILSTKTAGDQLWLKVMAPPSCAKSVLCEALSVAKKYVCAKSSLRGFHSGMTNESGDDFSPVNEMRDKALIVKDIDPLLKAPNVGQVLSEARDIYDRVSRTSYRNQASRDQEGLNIVMIWCGTSAARQLDASELGARFLDCVIMDGIDDELEDQIIWRKVNQARRDLLVESNGDSNQNNSPEMLKAMQLTGGYVEYLRENSSEILGRVGISDARLHLCGRLGKFVAFMRARPSKVQDEKAEREMAARLASQMTRLATCLAAVLNKREVDDEVMSKVVRVGLDTSAGQVLQISRIVYAAGESGMEQVKIAHDLHTDRLGQLLQFMQRIGMLEKYTPTEDVIKPRPRWRLTPRLRKLWREVIGEALEETK